MTFRVGQKVVCVEPVNDLVANRVYSILDIGCVGAEIFAVRVDQSKFCGPGRLPFFARRFRPLVERQTNISIFTAMLKPQGVDA